MLLLLLMTRGVYCIEFGCRKELKEVCELLLPRIVDAAINQKGDAALIFAAKNGHKEICKLLISSR